MSKASAHMISRRAVVTGTAAAAVATVPASGAPVQPADPVITLFDQWRALTDECGEHIPTEGSFERYGRMLASLEERMLVTSAWTIQGAICKAKVFAWCELEEDDEISRTGRLMLSAIGDLERLSSGIQ
jgi:hypothetical protein